MRDQLLSAAEAALQRGEWAKAVDHCRSALALSPGTDGAAQAMLGIGLLRLGQLADAIAALEQATAMARRNPHWLGHLAQAYAEAGRLDDAHKTFQRASRLAPRHWPFTQNAALMLIRQGKAAEAEAILRALARRHPSESDIQLNLGNVLLELGRPGDAEAVLRTALGLAQDDAQILQSLGSAQHHQFRFEEACETYRSCIRAEPRSPAPRLNLVSALIDAGRFAQAETDCLALLEIVPTLPDAHRFLGAARSFRGNTAGALRAFSRAAELAPESASGIRNLGGALAETGQLLPALRALAAAAQLDSESDKSSQLESSIFLAHGLFGDGWNAYRRRPAFLRFAEKLGPDTLAQHLPADVAGKHVLVLREQGIGDELFFLRYASQLRALGANVTVRASAKIATLIARSNCADTVIAGDEVPASTVDLQLLCGDLPYALSHNMRCTTSPAASPNRCRDFKVHISAYSPDLPAALRIPVLPDADTAVRQRLQQYGPPPYLGITWRAGTAARDYIGVDWVLSKELPLAALAHTLRGCSGTLLALQRHPAPDEISTLAEIAGKPVYDCTDLNDDLEKMLALLTLIDDYIGVSNTNMHLRAACGRPARVLVPNPAEWRWMHAGGESPWFPDFRIYRQTLDGHWGPSLAQLAADLASPRRAPGT